MRLNYRRYFVSFLILIFALASAFASKKTLDFPCVFLKDQTVPVTLEWRVQDMKDSSIGYNNDLAKAAVVLSRAIYVEDKILEDTIKRLGYSKVRILEKGDGVSCPVAAFAHQKHSSTNYFLIVVRGTASFSDFLTDLKSAVDFFEEAAANTYEAFSLYLQEELKKDEETVRKERNVFFVCGHSMGAAVANLLSRDLMTYADKDHIFTYTFECPSTGTPPEEAFLSNAINVINENDFVPELPFPEGRYGRDEYFLPEEMDPEIYRAITGEKLEDIVGFTIFNKWDNHLLDTSLTYVLSRDKGTLREVMTNEPMDKKRCL